MRDFAFYFLLSCVSFNLFTRNELICNVVNERNEDKSN